MLYCANNSLVTFRVSPQLQKQIYPQYTDMSSNNFPPSKRDHEIYQWNFTTMQDMSSLLFLEIACSIKCFAAD